MQLPKLTIDTRRFNQCFCCGKDNPIGLKLKIEWDGRKARAEFTPQKFHQGWGEITHGGIIYCLLDELMTYAALFEGANCVTATSEVKFKRPASVGEPLLISANVTKKKRKLIEAEGIVTLKDGTPVAMGTSLMYVCSEREGRE